MKLFRGPLLLALIILAFCSFLFVKGFKSPVKVKEQKSSEVSTAKLLNEEELEQKALASLTEAQRQKALDLQKESSLQAMSELARLYDSLEAWPVSGTYYTKIAGMRSTEANWMKAGNTWLQAGRTATDSVNVAYCVGKATSAFEKAVEINPAGTEAKNSLALCLAQNGSDVMRAVRLLKDVLGTDSNNVQAIFTLGMLSIQSGQYDKAVLRFERLREIEPFNPDNYFYLADIYNQLGEKEKAVKALEVCKTVTNDEKVRKNIDELIKEIKNN